MAVNEYARIDSALDELVRQQLRYDDELTRAYALTQLLEHLRGRAGDITDLRNDAIAAADAAGTIPSHRYLADMLGLSRARAGQLIHAAHARARTRGGHGTGR